MDFTHPRYHLMINISKLSLPKTFISNLSLRKKISIQLIRIRHLQQVKSQNNQTKAAIDSSLACLKQTRVEWLYSILKAMSKMIIILTIHNKLVIKKISPRLREVPHLSKTWNSSFKFVYRIMRS